jgi:hypothetical protein
MLIWILYIEARWSLNNKTSNLKINKICVCSRLMTMIQIISMLIILCFTGRFLHFVWSLPPWPCLYRISRLCPVIRTAEFNHPRPWYQQTCSTVRVAEKQATSVSESWGGNEFVSNSRMFTYVQRNCTECTERWRVSGKNNTGIIDEG